MLYAVRRLSFYCSFVAVAFIAVIMCRYVTCFAAIQESSFDEDVRWSFQSLPGTIDNLDWRSLDRWYLICSLFDTLIRYDINQNIISGIAARWHISSDRLTYVFAIRKDAFFSNGRKITASDVAYSLKRYLLLQNSDNLLKKNIVDADGIADIDADLAGVKVIDDSHIDIKLKEPIENIWSFLVQPHIGGIVARESIDPRTLLMMKSPVSSGPYVVGEQLENHIRLIANRFFHDLPNKSPKSVGFYRHSDEQQALMWFHGGLTNIYAILDPFQDYDHALRIKQFISYPLHRIGFINLNVKNKYLSSPFVRDQIYNAFQSVYLNKYDNHLLIWNNCFFPPGSAGFLSDLSASRPEKVSVPKSLHVILENNTANRKISAILKERFHAIGINVLFEYLSKSDIAKRFAAGTFEIGFASVGFPFSDLGLGAYMYFVEAPHYLNDITGNIGRFYKEYTQTINILERENILKKISAQVARDRVVIPIYHTAIRHIISDSLKISDSKNYRTDLQIMSLEVK